MTIDSASDGRCCRARIAQPGVNEGKRACRRQSSAFTLLELLVAVAITLGLAVLMLSIVVNALGLWRRTQGNAATTTAARLALDMIERDLAAAVFRPDGSAWMAASVTHVPADLVSHGWLAGGEGAKPAGAASQRLVPEPTAGSERRIGEARFGLSGVWLRLIAANSESGGSLPTAISYQIARRPVSGAVSGANPADVRYALFRTAVAPDATLAAGNDVTAAAYASTSPTPSVARSPSTLTNPHGSGVIARNVVDFGVWFFVREQNGNLRRIFPADAGDLAHVARGNRASPDAERFPEVADIMIRVLTDEGAALMAAIEHRGRIARPPEYGSGADWWWAVAEAHSQVFVRRVELRSLSP